METKVKNDQDCFLKLKDCFLKLKDLGNSFVGFLQKPVKNKTIASLVEPLARGSVPGELILD